MTDSNFLHEKDHVYLGSGVTGTRQTTPAVDLHDLPHIDLICLSHYYTDHFDAQVEAPLHRDLPIITTPHAKENLATSKEPSEAFKAVHNLDFSDDILVDIQNAGKGGKKAVVKVTGMLGKHVPPGPGGVTGKMNDLLAAVTPDEWMDNEARLSPRRILR
ncbi:hypothetical protein ABVK25_007256 [Lepraria finkii]|uniref:Uncharacterized protein n=1 Tax=Lepraria finkii TaxID=1340010 RepID=A0ABR4B668_9LECA